MLSPAGDARETTFSNSLSIWLLRAGVWQGIFIVTDDARPSDHFAQVIPSRTLLYQCAFKQVTFEKPGKGCPCKVSSAADGTACLRSGDLAGALISTITSLIAHWYYLFEPKSVYNGP
jgi:hypothetical protein